MAELTDEQRLAYARELHNNPLLAEILAIIRQAAVDTWDDTSPAQTEERERCWWMRLAANDLDSRIKNTITQLVENSDVE